MEGGAEGAEAAMKLIVNLAELAVAFQLIGGETESHQHGQEDEAVPELQTPFDGSEDFHRSMQ
jgi:hypothetical protein